jgi:hypothetical protein
MANPTLTPSVLEKPRKRLISKYRRLGSFHRLAEACGVNVKYVYEFLRHDKVPTNREIQKAMGIHLPKPVTINQLMKLDIQDMPTEILRLAFENREEMK